MKFICKKSDLLKGVNIVLKAVPSKTTMPILECILIDASAGQIKLTANDMELGIETVIQGTIEEKGIIAIDAKIFSEIIRKLPDNDVTIETDSSFQMKINCEKAKFAISGKSGEDFSYLPYIEKTDSVRISQFNLKEVIKQTIFSISDNENNKMMTGELFEIQDNRLKVVSLDGHRVSIRNIELKENYEPKKVIVPGKTLIEVSKILSGEMDDFVDLFFTKNHIVFVFDETVVVSRLVEGEYFRIEQMLSADYETKVRVNKKELLSCIDRATLLIRENDKKPVIIQISDFRIEQMLSADYETKVRVNKKELLSCIDRATLLIRENDKKPVIIQISDGEMLLKLTSGFGSMKEEILIEKEGKDILIGFNPKFLIDALRVIDDEMVTLYLVNPKAPCFIRDEKESYIYLILPVNFNSASV